MTAKICSVLPSLFGYLTVNWSSFCLHESARCLSSSKCDFNRLYVCTHFYMATLRDSSAQICGIPKSFPTSHYCPKKVLWLCHSVTCASCSHSETAEGLKTVCPVRDVSMWVMRSCFRVLSSPLSLRPAAPHPSGQDPLHLFTLFSDLKPGGQKPSPSPPSS